jgi:hypothetical protein
MQHSDFIVGREFRCGEGLWRVTDRGSRTVVAIRIDCVRVGGTTPALCRTLNRAEAEQEGWFNGPPFAIAEQVFDEEDLAGCALIE